MKEVPHVIGIDLGKSVFQVHAVDAAGRVIARHRNVPFDIEDFVCVARAWEIVNAITHEK